MFRRSFLLIPALFGLVALAGCSGSSSSGASTAYAGQYDGTLTQRLSGFGETLTQTSRIRIIVGVDGRVTAFDPNSSAQGQCNLNSVKPVYISGNTASASGSYSCNIAGIGSCSISGSATIKFSNNAASMTSNGAARCPQGEVQIAESGYAKKTA